MKPKGAPLSFPQKVIEALVERRVRGREGQKSSTFVNFSGRLGEGHFPLILKGKAAKKHAPEGRSQKTAHRLLSLYLRRKKRIGIISESQESSTFVTLTPDRRAAPSASSSPSLEI